MSNNTPWWKDGDAVGSFAATVCIILLLIMLAAGIFKFLLWMF